MAKGNAVYAVENRRVEEGKCSWTPGRRGKWDRGLRGICTRKETSGREHGPSVIGTFVHGRSSAGIDIRAERLPSRHRRWLLSAVWVVGFCKLNKSEDDKEVGGSTVDRYR